MADILEKIVATKRKEVDAHKLATPISQLETRLDEAAYELISLSERLKVKPGIIAEFKRASPSKGAIHIDADIKTIVDGYANSGAVAVSVLTDMPYFQANPDDFTKARQVKAIPLLRKEFIIDSYQIYESKALGANIILLIAAILTKKEVEDYTKLAHSLGLEVLLELHGKDEIDKIYGFEDVIGINNRNLKTFEVDINHSVEMRKKLVGHSVPLIAESGLSGIKEVEHLVSAGFSGFLMGEHFMKHPNPEETFSKFNQELNKILSKQ